MADGVRDMAAFLGRNLGFLDFGKEGSVIGVEFCASASDKMLNLSSLFVIDECGCSPVICGGRVSLNLGNAPAIEVSGTSAFRGGRGGMESIECGRYAVAVWSFRFEDSCSREPELKFRSGDRHGRRVVTPAFAANLKMLDEDDVRGRVYRWIDMMRGSRASPGNNDREIVSREMFEVLKKKRHLRVLQEKFNC